MAELPNLRALTHNGTEHGIVLALWRLRWWRLRWWRWRRWRMRWMGLRLLLGSVEMVWLGAAVGTPATYHYN